MIDRVTARNGLLPGPDLYAWFSAHPGELAPMACTPPTWAPFDQPALVRSFAPSLRPQALIVTHLGHECNTVPTHHWSHSLPAGR